jgi:hypothetical protein
MQIHRLVKRGIRKVIDSQTNEEMAVKLWCFCLAMGWFEVIDGYDSCTELAKKLKRTKADVNKFVCMFRDQIPDGMASMPPTSGQRDDRARATFAKKRMEQEQRRRQSRGIAAPPAPA